MLLTPIKIQIMALEIKGLQRVFKFRKGSSEIELADPDNSLSPNEVMDFYSMTYPELTTASVHGPECEDRQVWSTGSRRPSEQR